MKNPIIQRVIILSTLIISWSCDTDTNPVNGGVENYDQVLLIQTDSSIYESDSVVGGFLMWIHATVRNPSSDTFYARLGDGLYGGLDQDPLHIAEGTDGRFQKRAGVNQWHDLQRGMLIEGTSVVRLLPSREYSLWAYATKDSAIPGTFRLRIDYFRDVSRTDGDTLRDTSNTFMIH